MKLSGLLLLLILSSFCSEGMLALSLRSSDSSSASRMFNGTDSLSVDSVSNHSFDWQQLAEALNDYINAPGEISGRRIIAILPDDSGLDMYWNEWRHPADPAERNHTIELEALVFESIAHQIEQQDTTAIPLLLRLSRIVIGGNRERCDRVLGMACDIMPGTLLRELARGNYTGLDGMIASVQSGEEEEEEGEEGIVEALERRRKRLGKINDPDVRNVQRDLIRRLDDYIELYERREERREGD